MFQVLPETDCHNKMQQPTCTGQEMQEAFLMFLCFLKLNQVVQLSCKLLLDYVNCTMWWMKQAHKHVRENNHSPILPHHFLGVVTCHAKESTTCINDWKLWSCCQKIILNMFIMMERMLLLLKNMCTPF